MRLLALLLCCSGAAFADVVDLGQRGGGGEPAHYVIRAEGGNEYAPYGYAGATLSWLTGEHAAFEIGGGAGFPGIQLGLAARYLFGEHGTYIVAELALVGNTKVNRARSTSVNVIASSGDGSVWTNLGGGFEYRVGWIDVSAIGSIVFTTDGSPHWALHGGIGFGF